MDVYRGLIRRFGFWGTALLGGLLFSLILIAIAAIFQPPQTSPTPSSNPLVIPGWYETTIEGIQAYVDATHQLNLMALPEDLNLGDNSKCYPLGSFYKISRQTGMYTFLQQADAFVMAYYQPDGDISTAPVIRCPISRELGVMWNANGDWRSPLELEPVGN